MGTKFAEAFDITYLTKENKHVHAHTTSWGVSTRSSGALIMTHGDENGLVFPPTIAPTQVVLLPVGPWKNPAILEKLENCMPTLKPRAFVFDWMILITHLAISSMNGTKRRLLANRMWPKRFKKRQSDAEVRDLADKQTVALEDLEAFVDQELQAMTPRLLAAAKERNKDNEYTNIDTLDELKAQIQTCKQEDKVTALF